MGSVVEVSPKDAQQSCTSLRTPQLSKASSSDWPPSSEQCTRGRPSFTGTRERAWTRWSSRKPTRTCAISSLSIKTSRTPSLEMRKTSKYTGSCHAATSESTILARRVAKYTPPSQQFPRTVRKLFPSNRGHVTPCKCFRCPHNHFDQTQLNSTPVAA